MSRRMVKVSKMVVDLFSGELLEAEVALGRQLGLVEDDAEVFGHHSRTTFCSPGRNPVTLNHVNLELQ
jgi:hypothetical protein